MHTAQALRSIEDDYLTSPEQEGRSSDTHLTEGDVLERPAMTESVRACQHRSGGADPADSVLSSSVPLLE